MTIKEVSEKYHISQDTLRFVMTNYFLEYTILFTRGKNAKTPPAGILCAQRAFCFSCGHCIWVLISTARPPKFS